ncbi:hypothetical protein ACNAUY_00360 [Acinetobacter tibetensis]|uniref:hypothetical protein n=1 Tax=Acinetobacter tibetensis TaxID=2943497 RepID=UPI003A4E3B86
MQKHPMIEQLIEAHLQFLNDEFTQSETIKNEFVEFYHWFRKQKLKQIWTVEQIHQLIDQQILKTPASDFLIEQIAEHIRFALVHPTNDQTKIADAIPVLTVDKIAQYVASKSGHRQRLIHTVVNNPAFSAMITQLIQHAIHDYLDNSVMVKHVPGVSRFMKMGKSVLESVTDSNLDQAIQHYLQKNIQKLSQMSEQVLNQHFNDDKLYHFQANLWHKIKDLPLNVLKNYIEINDLQYTVGLGHEIWDHLRQTEYLEQQVKDGISAWYARNQDRSFDLLFRDLNIDEALIQNQLQHLLEPIIQNMLQTDYLAQRARHYLEKFYYSDSTLAILKKGAE